MIGHYPTHRRFAMPAQLPALALMANPGQRRATLDLAREIERRGFAGISVSSSFGNMSQCVGLAFATQRIPFATAIAPIYAQAIDEFAQNAAYLHEVSGGRFQFGIGIAHAPAYARFEVKPGTPLADTRAFVEKFKAQTQYGPLPPVILAALRKRMIALSGEIGDGVIFANGSRAFMPDSLAALPEAKRRDPNFLIGNRVRTCISDDVAEAKAALRQSMASYWLMPNYRNYWKETGYADEMATAEKLVADGRAAEMPQYLSDRWLADCTLFGPAAKVREGVEAWRDAGVTTPIVVPISPDGDQTKALRAAFDAFA
jgi:alkanesulfonate monooxygenase SsuD/methylene tetrahydromethanopterin reductase-like flavin-dependent oxidoreductase (luciferase family)